MGFDLSGRGGYFRWTASGWSRVLQLASAYGWTPSTTGAPRGTLKHEWNGNYESNDGQLFYARDAKQLAAALERFLAAKPPSRQPKRAEDAYFYTPSGRQSLSAFVAYCRRGSFRLH